MKKEIKVPTYKDYAENPQEEENEKEDSFFDNMVEKNKRDKAAEEKERKLKLIKYRINKALYGKR